VKVSATLKPVISVLLLTLTLVISACTNTASSTIPATSGTALNPPDKVEISYFYEKEACVCLALATVWINDTIPTDYKTQIESGKLVYHTYNSQDSANDAIRNEMKAPLVSFFITVVRGTDRTTHEVKTLWMYTDPSEKNEMLHQKFLSVMKGEIDKALAGN
jgi:hypothetical protein